MKKPMKKVVKVILWVVGAIVALILLLPLWIGPLVRGVANSIVPGKTGTTFHLGRFGLNQYTGGLSVGDLQLGNPEGYNEKEAVNLGSLDVNVAMTSLLSKKIRIESVALDGLTVYVSAGGGNFTKIAENASGGEKAEEKPEEEKPAEEQAESKSDEGGKKVQIDIVTLKNVKVKYGVFTLPIPDLTLKGIGKESEEGATFADAWEKIKTSALEAAGCVGGKLSDLGAAAADAAKVGAGAAADAAKAGASAVGDAAKNVGGAAADAAKAGAGAVGDAAKAGAGAVGDAAKNVGGAIKGLFK